jgi:16S rRNA (uracil1498-N3)-methyltransferase
MHRFYAPALAFDREVELPEEEAHHLARVLRLKAGDVVAVFDGRGYEATARVHAIAGRRVTIKAVEKRVPVREPDIAITLAQAVLKSDKMDRVVRDAVMMGVTAIQPFTSARTEVPRAALRSAGRQRHWDQTAIASAKQSGRAVVPVVHPTLPFSDLLKVDRDAFCLMFVEPSGAPVTLHSLETRVPAKATILIGPEGGWEPREIDDAAAAGVALVTFGPRVLRADAAGAVAIAVLRYAWKDL